MLYKIKHNYNPKLITDIFILHECCYNFEDLKIFFDEESRILFGEPHYVDVTFEIHAFFVDGKERCIYSDKVKCHTWDDYSTAKQKCVKEYNIICSLMDSVYPQWEV